MKRITINLLRRSQRIHVVTNLYSRLRQRSSRKRRARALVSISAGALLLLATSYIHWHLWDPSVIATCRPSEALPRPVHLGLSSPSRLSSCASCGSFSSERDSSHRRWRDSSLGVTVSSDSKIRGSRLTRTAFVVEIVAFITLGTGALLHLLRCSRDQRSATSRTDSIRHLPSDHRVGGRW